MKTGKIIALALALVLCLGMLCSCFESINGALGDNNDDAANQPAPEVPSEGLDFGLINEDAEYAVVGMGVCQDANVIVPAEHEGKPVTEIADEAFKDNIAIISIKLPASIVKVGDKAFSGCEALVSVSMSDYVEMGKDVFRGSINVEIAKKHDLVYVEEKAPTCEMAGNKAHYYCESCNEYYSDAQGENEIFDAILPAAHNFVDGVCADCSTVLSSVNIVSVDSVPYLGKFALGTLESAIGLPSEIYVTTGDGARHLLPVIWDLASYNKAVAGEYVIKGHIQAGALHFGEGVSSAVEAGIEIVEYMKGTADIVFVLDISGSMSSPISNVKNNLISFANAIDAAGISARYAIVTYSDFTCSDDPKEDSQVVKNGASDWYITADEARTAINGISLAGGGDGPETAVDGIMHAKTELSTRQDARVFYILLTDYSNKINNNYGVGSMEECGQILADADINLSVICPTEYYSHYSPLTSVTGGASLNISSSSFGTTLSNTLIPIIQSGVEN